MRAFSSSTMGKFPDTGRRITRNEYMTAYRSAFPSFMALFCYSKSAWHVSQSRRCIRHSIPIPAPLNNKTLLFAIFPQIVLAWRYLLFIFSQERLLLKSSQGIFRKANLRESTRDHSREALFSLIHLCFLFFSLVILAVEGKREAHTNGTAGRAFFP